MNIPLIDDRSDLDCCKRFYRRAIYNTLLELKPKFCLEIGTHIYQSSAVFSRYFQEHCPNGKLITIDIGLHGRNPIPPYGVYPEMVYPYISDPCKHHGGLKVYYENYQEYTKLKPETIRRINKVLIEYQMMELDMDRFDFVFVDGCHTKTSFVQDLYLVKELTKDDGFILIDDIHHDNHEQFLVYQQLKKRNDFYEYEQWYPNPGMGLLQNKRLSLNDLS